jgi:hypothetical protein
MGQWITDLMKWLEPFEHPLAIIASVVTILGITVAGVISAVVKPVRLAIWSFCSRLFRPRQNTANPRRTDLRFVCVGNRPFIGDLQGENGNRNVEIFSNWVVTNNSESGVPIHLLTATLARPGLNEFIVHSLIFVAKVRGDPQGPTAMAPGESRRVDFRTMMVLPPGKLRSLRKVQLVVTDQLANEHKLPLMKPHVLAPGPAETQHGPR